MMSHVTGITGLLKLVLVNKSFTVENELSKHCRGPEVGHDSPQALNKQNF